VEAVAKALELGGRPMRAREIHAAVEQLLEGPVSQSSVKEALSAHARCGNPRFRRIGYGLYELA
jgi:hypothetical protein